MYSVLKKTPTHRRDSRGLMVYSLLYLCDTIGDVDELPTYDAPGSGAVVADGGSFYLLNNNRRWCRADGAACLSGALWAP